jgi:UDP-glucose 4-epimerase
MKKVLVTGGAGYIGSHTCVELIQKGYIPVIVDNFSNSDKAVLDRIKEITGIMPNCYDGDCRDERFLSSVFKQEGDIDGVIHFAALKVVSESIKQPLAYYDNNLRSLIVLLGVMKEFGVKRIVFSSSAAVYGDQSVNPVDEIAETRNSLSPYATTKIIAEGIVRDVVTSGVDLSAVILRYFNPIGAHPSGLLGEYPSEATSNVVQYLMLVAAKKRAKLVVFGNDYDTKDGSCIRDFIHVMDLARAHIATLEFLSKQSQPYIGVFNVGTGQGTSVLELIDIFKTMSGVELPHEIGPRRPGDIPVSFAKNTKIAEIMGWRAEYSVEDALRHAWEWQKRLNT